MTPFFHYNKETGMLDEQPRMEKPDFLSMFYSNSNAHDEALGRWTEHNASLRHIPTDFKDWPLKTDLVEARDFEIINEVPANRRAGWIDNKAVPVAKEKSNQYELFLEVGHVFSSYSESMKCDFVAAIRELQSKYTITKRI